MLRSRFEREIASLESANVDAVEETIEVLGHNDVDSPSTSNELQKEERPGSTEPVISGPMLPTNGVSKSPPTVSQPSVPSATTFRNPVPPIRSNAPP